ncbi:hypothetical protein J26TS2_41590 [Shouchella clausii]|uniref:nuclear transport factor 2 family protein n=1 Tax=Shouchella tritolerans TaxID=2979466 RepID=UPI000787CFB5|nr:nuclear transport factor 2 family protein [Shouchella tritolerans]GIN14292.1 hypothetical protein J26TS2_41590 [Shouchella clausii]
MESLDRLNELVAKQEINEQLYAYCRGMDRIDNELAKNVWHPDGRVDYGDTFKGTGEEFVEWVSEQHRHLQVTSHQITNILIEVKGRKAFSESYVTMAGRIKRGDKIYEQRARGRYLDRWSYRNGRWAIDDRQFINDFANITELSDAGMPQSTNSKRDRTDASYHFLEKW